MSASKNLTETLANFAVTTPLTQVPVATQTRLKECLLDLVGNSAFAAVYAESSPAFRAGARALSGGGGDNTVIGEAHAYPFMQAALLNGAYAHTLDFDDTNLFGSLHPGASVIPAALAEAERVNASGAQLLAALAVGNEITCRVGGALGNTAFDRGFHPTAVCGIFGATAAAGRLRGMESKTLASALGIAGSKAAGSMQYLENGSWNKRLHPGFAAHDALVALAFAEAGVIGTAAPLEGQYGLLAGYSNAAKPALLTERLNEWWAAGETALKPYPCCRFGHAAIDAALALRERFTPEERAEARLRLRLSAKGAQIVGERVSQKLKPANVVDGQFSVYFHVAAAWLDGRYNWRSYDRLGNADIEACNARITVVADQGQTIAGADLIASVGGREESVSFAEPLGEGNRPFAGADVRRKFDDQAVPIFGSQLAGEIAERALNIDKEPSVREWLRLLRKGVLA